MFTGQTVRYPKAGAQVAFARVATALVRPQTTWLERW